MPPGFKRSRAIWDETKHGGIRAWVNAICYELQPLRLSKSSRKEAIAKIVSLGSKILALALAIPSGCKALLIFISQRNSRQWMIVGAIFVYYWFVRLVHEALDAGPVVLIVTALTLIFSIGLSDDENKGELSAYSVFNRGFEQLMGSVDADALLAQHVGGGFMMNMNQHNDAPDRHRNRENAEPPNLLRHDNDDNHPVVANDNEDNARQNDNELNNNNRARKSGKKARRRNLDQRRDLRRQREAAIQMDLDEVRGGIDGAVDVQRAIEEQIVFENNR